MERDAARTARRRCILLAGPPAEYRDEWAERMSNLGFEGGTAHDIDDALMRIELEVPTVLVLFETSTTVDPVELLKRLQQRPRIEGMEVMVVRAEGQDFEPLPEVEPAKPVQTPTPEPVRTVQPTRAVVKPVEQPKPGMFGWLKKLFGKR